MAEPASRRQADDFRLMVITPVQDLPREKALVRDLFAAGLPCLHLRKPGKDIQALSEYLSYFNAAERARIRVHHTRPDLLQLGIAGLHVPYSAIGRSGYANASLSTSIHHWKEYNRLGPNLAYVLISPVYDSLSKPGYRQNKEVWNLPPRPLVPIVALGGIHSRNILPLLLKGFSGAALLGAIWQQPEKSVQVFEEIKKRITIYEK
ncbi:MAG: thiamine phosphate synthase [Solitalea sp.]